MTSLDASDPAASTSDDAYIVPVIIGGKRMWKVLVLRPNGQQFLSEHAWPTQQDAEDAFLEHLKELGADDYTVSRGRLH